jgi:hypothetical protein
VLLYCVRQETFQKCDVIVKAVCNSTYWLETEAHKKESAL